MTFASLNLSPTTLNALAAMRFETPTPVQGQAIPVMLAGKDLIAQARTGTGKTAAFGLPIVERHLKERKPGIVALVLVPTRELALQVTEEMERLAAGSHLRVIPIYGGVGFGNQTEALRRGGSIALVATPGRLLDHLQQRTLRLDGVRTLILDEADRMLDMGFLPDVERIMRSLPKERQTALFSATVPEPIRRLSQNFLRQPEGIRVESGPAATPLTEQFKIEVTQAEKGRALQALLAKEKVTSALVFTRTKHLARRLARNLEKAGWDAVALQGNMSQAQRERAMAAFRGGAAQVLVATDIASRGIDVAEISHVVNYDIPLEPDVYVHRIGRTGRMGRTGRAFTFVQPDQARDLRDVERAAGTRLEAYDVGELPPPVKTDDAYTPPFHSRFSERRNDGPRMRPPQQRSPQAGSRGRDERGERRYEPQPPSRPPSHAPPHARPHHGQPHYRQPAGRPQQRRGPRRGGNGGGYDRNSGRGWW